MPSKPALRALALWLLVALPVGLLGELVLRPSRWGWLSEAVILVWGAVLLVRAHEAQRTG